MKWYGILLALLLLIIAGFVTSSDRGSDAQTTLPDEQSFSVEWRARIRAEGPDRAYGEFLEKYAQADVKVQHVVAHYFGSALLDEIGEKGITSCDATFSFGCYHEIIGRLARQSDVTIVPKLGELCRELESAVGCQHGIGHGIQSRLGYTKEDLHAALAACHTLSSEEAARGCYSGAFMEFNVRQMIEKAQDIRKTARPYTGDLYDLCRGIDDVYLSECYASLPPWWLTTQQFDGPDYAGLGNACELLPHTAYVLRCFQSLGATFAFAARLNAPDAAHWCERATTNAAYQLACKERVASSYTFTWPQAPEHARAACNGLPPEEYEFCTGFKTR